MVRFYIRRLLVMLLLVLPAVAAGLAWEQKTLGASGGETYWNVFGAGLFYVIVTGWFSAPLVSLAHTYVTARFALRSWWQAATAGFVLSAIGGTAGAMVVLYPELRLGGILTAVAAGVAYGILANAIVPLL
jgi:hypothetical protein